MATRPATRQRRRRPVGSGTRRPAWVAPAVIAGAVIVAAVAGLIAFRSARPGALPGTHIDEVAVGGLAEADLRQAVTTVAQDRRTRRIDIRHGPLRVPTTAAAAGYDLDVDATVSAVMRHGRQLNPVAALADHLAATVTDRHVQPVEQVDEDTFRRWVVSVGADLGIDAVKGNVVVTGAEVDVLPPPPGEIIDAPALQSALLAAVGDPSVEIIEIPTTTATPDADADALDRLADEAERAISAPVTLTRDDVSLTFSGERIGELLEVRTHPVTGAGGSAGLELAIDPDGVAADVGAERRESLTEAPRDATFEVVGDDVRLIPSTDGFAFDPVMAAEQLLAVATNVGPRTEQLEGMAREPELTTAEADELGIVEPVASYTTEHPCCAGRVTNIQRMADLVGGAVVRPGETFSLNAHVGPRTREAGFVDGGAISGGEFTDQIGGGVSQFATTLFNAVFFAGYELVEFQPHSYYIPRYPVGREATLNFDPPIDLAFRNDSPHGVYVHTAYTDTSITVTLLSTRWAEVESTTSDRYGVREPEEEITETDERPADTEEVVQSGRNGFSVDVTREISYVDGRHETERYTTTYLPEPRIIEVGTGTDDASEPTPSESSPPSTEPPAENPTPDPVPTTPAPTRQPTPGPTPAPAPTAAPAPGPAGGPG